MAANDEGNLTYSGQQIEELLKCPICWDRFKNPKVLPCQHTFCERPCLEQLIDRFHQVKCPECRQEHRVPYAGVSAFPTNRTLLNFLELPSQRSQPLPPVPAAPVSDQRPRQEPHPVSDQQRSPQAPSQQSSPLDNNERSGCALCRRQMPLSRCPHCDGVICDTCKRSHIDQLRLDINRLISQLRRGIPSFSDSISVIENKSEQLHQRAEAAKAEITETIERYISELRNRQRSLHSEIQMWLLGEIRSLRMCQENVEVELASTASFCDSTESLLLRPNQTIPDDDLADLKRQCVEHMEIIRAYEEGSGVRLPRERQVQVIFEDSRFSLAISNVGELVVVESSTGGSSGSASDPPSITSRSSSSRESSPAVAPRPSGRGRTTAPVGLDTALNAIGSSPRPTPRNTERAPGLMGAGGGHEAVESSSPSRQTARERQVGLTGGEPTQGMSPRPPRRERISGLMGAEASTSSAASPGTPGNRRRQVPPSTSWELPVDFSFPPRSDIRAGNGNRRSLQERRRHNLSDTRLPGSFGGLGSNRRSNDSSPSNENSTRRRSSDQNNVRPEPSTSRENSDQDRPPIVRSRTYTREDFQTIREEDTVSRANTADPTTRPREPVRFDINLSNSGNDNQEVTYQVASVDGGESIRVNVARNNYQDKGRAIIRFGSRGSENSEFVWPRGIAISRLEHIYVADSSNHRVQVFDNIGSFIKLFGSYGQADGEFDCLAGIAINSMGDILITDRYNHRIQVFDHHGNFKLTFGEEGQGDGQMCYPWGIATDNMGFIYVCDKENHRVQVFQSNGVFVRKFGGLGRSVSQFENPHYLAVSPEGKVYVSDSSNHRVQVFSIYGDFVFSFGSSGTMQGQMKYPKGIAIDEQGFVVVADSGNNRIQVFRGDGRFYSMFGGYGSDSGQFKGLEGLAILGNGNVVVSDRENHRIQIF